jgi:hypothetical protein
MSRQHRHDLRRRFTATTLFGSPNNKQNGNFEMEETTSARARRILTGRAGITDPQVNTVIGLLIDSGILKTSGVDPLVSAAKRHASALYIEASATAKRLGLEPDPDTGLFDSAEVSEKMAGADVPTRMGVKDLLSSAGLMA